MSVYMKCGGEEADMRANRIETEKMEWEQKQADKGRFAEGYSIDQFETKEQMWITLKSFIHDYNSAYRDARRFEKEAKQLSETSLLHNKWNWELRAENAELKKRIRELESQNTSWASLANS